MLKHFLKVIVDVYFTLSCTYRYQHAMLDSALISCSFSLVPISMLTAVLILYACNAANTELGRGGQSYVSVAWEVLQVFSEELGGKMNCA